ncbi:MAG: pyruvate:ferredoxin (flavodoxin) oxidoreductase [Bdellovibrionaceae bacterium]|nr:pyruvate:ferredoxin (flavodoxin) oxidoreductase [Pseudobdellovibrionaceae bacterium]
MKKNADLNQEATLDGNEAAASVAYRFAETIAIYPITPSSTMAELADEWSSKNKPNLWGTVPALTEMQSEGGAAGAIHGMLQTGAMSTTFTASQGLLLMIPNMYKIAGELTPFCMHVSARTLATHALSIFGDHSDVMACRQIGFAMLCSGSVQEAHDFAAISQATTLKTRIPFLHFFDGFRTSHEVAKISMLSDESLLAMTDNKCIEAFRKLALTPDNPMIRGTAQNPDVFFQAREACNSFYSQVPDLVQKSFDQLAELTGRKYKLFDYVGHPEADRVIVIMGSGSETTHETVNWCLEQGQKVGVLKVRLYRPFSAKHFLAALPLSVKKIAVLDRTKEPGALGEPLYQDVVTALFEANNQTFKPTVVGGRYGLSSKEFTPSMVKGIFDELAKSAPKNHFTIGINDDVSHTSLDYDPDFDIEPKSVTRCVFFGLGADGTVGANKNSIKIIGEETKNFAQGYFVYDSKKSGAITISHLRFGPKPIQSSYLVKKANFVACHQWDFLDKFDVLECAAQGGVLLLNSSFSKEKIWDQLSKQTQTQILEKKLRVYAIDAYKVARETSMGGRINTIMQTCFFAISGVLPREEAIGHIKTAIKKTYSKKGSEMVERNFKAVDHTLQALFEVPVPGQVTSQRSLAPLIPAEAPDFAKRVSGMILAGKGDLLPVSAFPIDGTWPTGTTKWEKRNIAQFVPVWDPGICIQCNKCVLVCPHAAIRASLYEPEALNGCPSTFKSMDFKSKEHLNKKYTIQVAVEDCTGCSVCVEVCPGIDKSNPRHRSLDMMPQLPLRDTERENFDFFLKLPQPDRSIARGDTKMSQFLEPLFEFSGACSGCGETPYLKLLTQLYGDRLVIANATGCSSIYGGNLPTTPYTKNAEGRGPAWSNSLFEDNAEYGYGMRVAVDKHLQTGLELLKILAPQLGDVLVHEILRADQSTEAGIFAQRARISELKAKLKSIDKKEARRLEFFADYLVHKSVWIVGGDGWAYDIGFGGLDHVMAQGRKVNILVMDTEVYSNTGGQASKATPMGASAKFAIAGKMTPKKDLGMMAMSYGNVFVARIAYGARDLQTVQAFAEAESFPGTSIIIAYSHCIAHGYGMHLGLEQQKLAVDSGYWPLFRFDPRKAAQGLPALKLDSQPPKIPLKQYLNNEIRFRMLEKTDPTHAAEMQTAVQRFVIERYQLYEHLAKHQAPSVGGAAPTSGTKESKP